MSLLEACSITFSVDALPTGVSRDVHGLLTLSVQGRDDGGGGGGGGDGGDQQQCAGGSEASASASALRQVTARFKVLEGVVRVSRS